MVYGAQIHNQSLALLLTEASYTLHFGEKPWSETGLLPFEWTLIREFLVSSYDQSTYPQQLELCSYILICIYADQSELLYDETNWNAQLQSGQCHLDQSELCSWIPHLHKHEPARDQCGKFLYKRWPPLIFPAVALLGGCVFLVCSCSQK